MVAVGCSFRRVGVFEDPGVAADEVKSFRSPREPTVLRVTARGGGAAERRSLAGDWLCDADEREPSRLPPAEDGLAWGCSSESWRWAAGREWLDAWEACDKGAWMAYAAAECGVSDSVLGRAMCACLRRSLSINVDPAEPRAATILEAVTSVEAWCGLGERNAVAVARYDSMWRAPRQSIMMPVLWRLWSATGNLLEWCLIRAAAIGATAATQAANAVGVADVADRSDPLSRVLRSSIQTVVVLRAVSSAWRARRVSG